MTDYTKKFLAMADKSNNAATDDNEGPGLEVIPEEFTEDTLKTVEKVIQDENLMKRIVRYNLLTLDEQQVVEKELYIIQLKDKIDEIRERIDEITYVPEIDLTLQEKEKIERDRQYEISEKSK